MPPKKAKTAKTQPLPLLPLPDATDKAAWFPNWVTEQVKQGDVDPVRTAYLSLPVHRRNNVKRKWETAMHEEELDMKDKEREKWLNDMKDVNQSHGGLIMSIQWERSYSESPNEYHFPNSEVAAKALSDWLTKHAKTHTHLQCDEFPLNKYDFETCFKIVSNGTQLEFWSNQKDRVSTKIRTQERVMCILFQHHPKIDTSISDCLCLSCNATPKKKKKNAKPGIEVWGESEEEEDV